MIEVNPDPKLGNQFGTIFFGGPSNITVDIVPTQDNVKNHPPNQSTTYFGKSPISQDPIGMAKKNVCILPKKNEYDQTKQKGNLIPSTAPITVGTEFSLKHTMPSTSCEFGEKSMAKMNSGNLDKSWGTPYSCDYIHPLFMHGDQTLSSDAVKSHAFKSQDHAVIDKETSPGIIYSNVMVDNTNESGQINESVLEPWASAMADGNSVQLSNEMGKAIAALSSSFVLKDNVQNIWGDQNTNNNTNVASITLDNTFSTVQNAKNSWGTPSVVGIEKSILPCQHDS